jgi:hypothetical protein
VGGVDAVGVTVTTSECVDEMNPKAEVRNRKKHGKRGTARGNTKHKSSSDFGLLCTCTWLLSPSAGSTTQSQITPPASYAWTRQSTGCCIASRNRTLPDASAPDPWNGPLGTVRTLINILPYTKHGTRCPVSGSISPRPTLASQG